jgi:hypothetical protein
MLCAQTSPGHFEARWIFLLPDVVFQSAVCYTCTTKSHHNILTVNSAYALIIIASLLRECRTLDNPYDFYSFAVAYGIFFKLANYLLLVVVVWGVNSLLQQRLGSGQISKVVSLVILGVMGALTCGYLGLGAYNSWTSTPDGRRSDLNRKYNEENKLTLAYWILYMLSVLASGGLSIVAVVSMRSKLIPAHVRPSLVHRRSIHQLTSTQGLLGWVIAIVFCMFFWALLSVIEYGSVISDKNFSLETYQAMEYLIGFFQIFSLISILILAKSHVWTDGNAAMVHDQNEAMYQTPAYAPPPAQYSQAAPPNQSQYQYVAQPAQQQYYYNQQSTAGHKA